MTNHAHAQAHAGSSLFQARNTHNHRHLHSNQHVPNLPKRDNRNHVRFHHHENLENRQAPTDPDPVVIVQTVSVVKVIDGSGAVISVSTISDPAASPATQVNQAAETLEVGVQASLDLGLTVDLANPSPSGTSTLGDSSPSGTNTADTVHVTNTSSSASPSDEATLTSVPLSSPTGLPSLPLSLNSTSSRQSLFSNSTLFRSLFANSTTVSSSSTLFPSSTDTFESSVTANDLSPSSVNVVTVITTETANAGSGDDEGAAPTTIAPSATAASDSSPGLPKETRNAVIGGVVGGIAGMALIVFLAMVILRWKRQQSSGISRLRDRSSSITGRALPPAPSTGGGDGPGSMSERSAPFMIPSALATLTGYKRTSRGTTSSVGQSTGEKGFYRVSGKKLMPVIQSGGDGYSDPHDSLTTDVSFYRDSQGYFGGSGALQLGSPMRPESGVPIIRSGPGRTPIQEQGPFSDHAHPLTPPPLTPPTIDPLGRSLISQDGSRGSGSRFTEEM